jgi:ABC-type transport system involved in multi-copper enzyme maturation permease subunit
VSSGSAFLRIRAVAGITAREALRRRVLLAAFIMSLGFLAIYGIALHFAAKELLATGPAGMSELMRREASAQMLYMGLFPASFLVAATAVFAAAGTISSEVDSGVMHGVLSRPIRRTELVLGKFLGLAVMLAVFAAVLNGAIIALAHWQIGAPLNNWAAGLAVLVLEPMPLLALALLGSTRLPTLANGILCIAVYAIGFIGGLIEQIGGLIQNTTMVNIGIVSSLLMPLDALHRKALSLLLPQGLLLQSGGGPLGVGANTTPSVWMVVYAILYVAVVVFLATRAFRSRDL